MGQLSDIRTGRFTSSEIHRLMGDGKGPKGWPVGAWTYIEECNMERRLGRSIDKEVSSRPITWGKCCENLAFEKLTINYSLCSNNTIVHPDYDFWCGTPDVTKAETVGDIKSPETLKSFCQLLDAYFEYNKTTGERTLIHKEKSVAAFRANHKDGDKFFYQLVSNAILTASKYAELIVFCPYYDQLEEVRRWASRLGGHEYQWITYASDAELSYVLRDTHYKNMNTVHFEVSQEDKDAMVKRVCEAGEYLIKI